MSSNKVYSEDDLTCFQNLQWEISELSSYLTDCNKRKIDYFKLSLVVMSLFFTGFSVVTGSKISIAKLGVADNAQSYVAHVILILMGLVMYTIIRELYSIHASRLTALRQINCLRQAMDSVRYRKHEGEYPQSVEELLKDKTVYWKAFGKHRKLPITNDALREFYKPRNNSPDMLMIFVLLGISTLLQVMGMIMLFFQNKSDFKAGVLCGVCILAVLVLTIADLRKARKNLLRALGVESKETQQNGNLGASG